MQIEYGDEDLRRLAEDLDFTLPRWGRDLVKAFRKKIQILGAAKDERDLRAMRSIRFEQLTADRIGTCSIRLNDQYRLILSFRTEDTHRVVVVVEMADYH